MKLLNARTGSTWLCNHMWVGKLYWYVTSHPGQFNLAIPLWVVAISTDEIWGTPHLSLVLIAPKHGGAARLNGKPHDALTTHLQSYGVSWCMAED